MKICKNCGAAVADDAVFCNVCGAKLDGGGSSASLDRTQELKKTLSDAGDKAKDIAGSVAGSVSDFTKNVGDKVNEARENYRAANLAAGTNTLVYADGEVPIREYAVTRVFRKKAKGNLLVTNKRIIFYAGTTKDRVVLSTPVSSVGSIDMIEGNHLEVKMFIFGFILLIAGLFMLTSNSRYGFSSTSMIGLILMAVGGIICWNAFRNSMFIRISAQNSSVGMMIGKPNTFSEAIYTIDGESAEDATKAMNELGALVLDLQQMGDLAIDKWKI